jgi:hypothetical protein
MNASSRFDNTLRYRDEADPRQVALTPAYVLDPVRSALGGIDLDPCTEPDNPVGAARFYALPQDGATLPWNAESIFVNPPYGRARERFVDRCLQAAAEGSRVVLLMPAHTDTRCFQKAAADATEVLLVRGRLKFGVLRPNRRQAAASHPSALFAWNVSLGSCGGIGMRVRHVAAPEAAS